MNFINVFTVIAVIAYGEADVTPFLMVDSYLISVLYQCRTLFLSLVNASIMFEWIALLLLVVREKYYSVPELLY